MAVLQSEVIERGRRMRRRAVVFGIAIGVAAHLGLADAQDNRGWPYNVFEWTSIVELDNDGERLAPYRAALAATSMWNLNESAGSVSCEQVYGAVLESVERDTIFLGSTLDSRCIWTVRRNWPGPAHAPPHLPGRQSHVRAGTENAQQSGSRLPLCMGSSGVLSIDLSDIDARFLEAFCPPRARR